MKEIVIVSKVVLGARPAPSVGLDGGFNPFKKALSRKLSDALNEKLIEKKMDYKADVDHTYDSLEDLIKDGADLVLISPYVKEHFTTANVDKANYYMLSEDEFNHAKVEDIINYLEK